MKTTQHHMIKNQRNHLRFHQNHQKLNSQFDDWFALKAEKFARFFGTPLFIVLQSIIVLIWILTNIFHIFSFDEYPFILLNLAFSLQAAYAAPLILLAQSRQSDREKAYAEADAEHREELAHESLQREVQISQQNSLLIDLIKQNTELTLITQNLSQRIEKLTTEIHSQLDKQ